MDKIEFALANTIHWDPKEGDKVYLERIYFTVTDFPFDMRKVILRFANGPKIDLSIVDMDRIAIEYLKMRGAKLSAKVRNLVNAAPPPRCDFVVPGHLASKLLKRPEAKSTQTPIKRTKPKRPKPQLKKKHCARCRQEREVSGDWYGDLCPPCADRTEGDWICEFCGRHGSFEVMGGSRADDPNCCGRSCIHEALE
jgi:hypothetical protein